MQARQQWRSHFPIDKTREVRRTQPSLRNTGQAAMRAGVLMQERIDRLLSWPKANRMPATVVRLKEKSGKDAHDAGPSENRLGDGVPQARYWWSSLMGRSVSSPKARISTLNTTMPLRNHY